ncbi:hypothetical protein BJF90_10075 [Pseudonocardia sp. CNS-004]|nr:hypothetical protein BJF90_10075 [Pseudonocardia sp. CNS-004]
MTGLRAALRRPETFEAIFEVTYLGLGGALCVGVAALPLVAAGTLLADPLAAWPTLLVAALPLGAGIAAAFHVFAAARERGVPARRATRGRACVATAGGPRRCGRCCARCCSSWPSTSSRSGPRRGPR